MVIIFDERRLRGNKMFEIPGVSMILGRFEISAALTLLHHLPGLGI
jgi:hypothetical protein